MHHAAPSHESFPAPWCSAEWPDGVSTTLWVLLKSLLARSGMRIVMRPLLVARLPRISTVHRPSRQSLCAPHALVKVVRSCSSLSSILLSAAFLHKDLVAEVLVRSENACPISSWTRTAVLAIEMAQPLGFSDLS